MGLSERLSYAWNVLTKPARDWPRIGLDDWAMMLSSMGYVPSQTLGGKQEEVEPSYTGLATGAFKGNSVIFGLMTARQFIFMQARFAWRQRRGGQPGPLFGNPELARLEVPWTNGSTTDLLARAMQDADLAGNSYYVRTRTGLARLRPDWTTLVIGSPSDDPYDPEAAIAGYLFHPGGRSSGITPDMYLPEEVAHWAPTPDPDFRFRGMSWVGAITRELMADNAATDHKLKFFENGATPNMIIKIDTDNVDKFDTWRRRLDEGHRGLSKAYKTLYMGAGQDATVVGSNLQQMDFKVTQGAGETRMALASGIHPVIAGLSEGLSGSSLNAGNFNSARRLTADKTFRPLWQGICEALQTVLITPPGAELWYREDEIPFLMEDAQDKAAIQAQQSAAIQTLINAGMVPESAIDAITTGDMTRLKHTGLYSVQLQPPMPETPAPTTPTEPVPPKSTNGQGRESIHLTYAEAYSK